MELQSDPKDKNDDKYRDDLIESIYQYLLNGRRQLKFSKFSIHFRVKTLDTVLIVSLYNC
jgi:hypothetical protein